MEPEEVTFQLLREMTDNFSSERELGKGSFGVVYRGVTHAGEDVAVKKLKDGICDNTGSKQFKNEIYHLGMLRHQNIVQILGYCYEIEKKQMVFNGEIVLAEEPHRAICLEYLHNGSLHNHLSDEFGRLDWDTRFKIIRGTCEGLKYFLHDLQEHLYHLDLKPDNILLDKDMAPKIADFGLSMIFSKELKTITTHYDLGTLGYQPPEYIDKGEVSDKFDIFSLGVVMIKIVSGQKGYENCGHMSSDEFTNQVQKNWRHRLQETFNGSSLEMYCCQVETCIKIALKCVEKDWQRRPDIVMITEKLNEIETDKCTVAHKANEMLQLPWNGCDKNIFRTTGNYNKKRKKSKDITGQHCNTKVMARPNCSELEFVHAQDTSPYVVKELIVGRDKEKLKIVTSLLKVISKQLVILPIYGIGGIGKTTLARLIYNDPKFRSYSQVWVDVTQTFDLAKIKASIVLQLSREESCNNERQTIYSLTDLSNKKNILVVLDDLWEDNQFQLDELKDMLNNKDSNIIVLVTTRSEDVAHRICYNLQPHKILPLANDMCWDIIKQKSGFDARDDNEQLIRIGLEIAQKCGGVALAAQSLGFTLGSMNIDQWMTVKDSDTWNLPNDHVLASLKLSYSYMAPCLKKCFTYCAIFPKGHKMVIDDLVYQWISLDFIKPTKLHSNMHLCEKYVMQLLGLSFFQQYSLSPKTYEGAYCAKQNTLFTMHDLVHDLATLLLGDEIMDQSKHSYALPSSCQYALLTNCSELLELRLPSCASLTALHFIHCRINQRSGAAFAHANSLRVLDLRECHIQKLPKSIGRLQQLCYLKSPEILGQLIPDCITKLSKLKYLDISGSKISALPESIGEMAGLVHLDISWCSQIEQLPVSFRNLENLVHLNLSQCSSITGVSEFLGSLRRLQHLDLSFCESIGEQLPEALGSLTELQYLDLSYCSYLQVPDAEVLGSLSKLKYLDLSPRSSPLRRLPEALGSFTALEYLNLSGCEQLEELPTSFGKLCSLVHLNLSNCFCLNNIWDALRDLTKLQCLNLHQCSISVFRNRQHLSFKGLKEAMSNLTELRFLDLSHSVYLSGGHSVSDILKWISNLTNLEHLDLSSNHKLRTVPDAFGQLKKLHTLDLSYSSLQRLPESISEIGNLKFLNTMGCDEFDITTHPQYKKHTVVSVAESWIKPRFVVHSADDGPSSNLVLLKDVDDTPLVISMLENVKSVEEAQTIKLVEKQRIRDLEFEWTRDAKRFVEDIGVLTELVPPSNLQHFVLQGYTSLTFPSWMMGITRYLPQLAFVSLKELPWCSVLPPLGQLPNLAVLRIEQVHSIRKIGGDLYGGTRAFPALRQFHLNHMDNLQEWNTIGYSDEDGGNVLVLPMLQELSIENCPILCLKPYPHICGDSWHIGSSDNNAVSLGGERVQVEDSFSSNLLHQCGLVLCLPALENSVIMNCSDMTSSSLDILRGLSSLEYLRISGCKSITAFPDCLGNLTSLEVLRISDCPGIKRLPESIKLLTNLKELYISGCPELVQCCESDEKIMKLLCTSDKESDGDLQTKSDEEMEDICRNS